MIDKDKDLLTMKKCISINWMFLECGSNGYLDYQNFLQINKGSGDGDGLLKTGFFIGIDWLFILLMY